MLKDIVKKNQITVDDESFDAFEQSCRSAKEPNKALREAVASGREGESGAENGD